MSKSKSTWDAVNEFKSCRPVVMDGKWLFNYSNTCSVTGYSYGGKEVCTKSEFNALVEEMTLGLDVNPVSHGHYLNYVNADKTLLKKEFEVDYTSKEFWKDAPEDANYYWEPSKSFYKFSDCEEDFVFDNDEWVPCSDISRFLGDDLFERPQSTPIETPEEKEALDSIVNKPLVYTQEMDDDGELPSVGMECMAYIYADTSKQGNPMDSWVDGEFIGKCKSSNGGFCFVFKAKDDIHHVINANSHFKPIDTRTDKEKAIDDIANLLIADKAIESKQAYDIAISILNVASDGDIYGVKWVGE